MRLVKVNFNASARALTAASSFSALSLIFFSLPEVRVLTPHVAPSLVNSFG